MFWLENCQNREHFQLLKVWPLSTVAQEWGECEMWLWRFKNNSDAFVFLVMRILQTYESCHLWQRWWSWPPMIGLGSVAKRCTNNKNKKSNSIKHLLLAGVFSRRVCHPPLGSDIPPNVLMSPHLFLMSAFLLWHQERKSRTLKTILWLNNWSEEMAKGLSWV